MPESTATETRPSRGELLTLDVESLAYGGRGVARRNGSGVFVSGALPGDRIPPRCDHGGEPCPGAPWQGLAYEVQLAHKQSQVEDSLVRLGGLDGFELEAIEPAIEQWRYRN